MLKTFNGSIRPRTISVIELSERVTRTVQDGCRRKNSTSNSFWIKIRRL